MEDDQRIEVINEQNEILETVSVTIVKDFISLMESVQNPQDPRPVLICDGNGDCYCVLSVADLERHLANHDYVWRLVLPARPPDDDDILAACLFDV